MAELVVGLDGSAGSRGALRWAIDEARFRGDDLAVVTVARAPTLLHGLHAPSAVAGGSDIEAAARALLEEELAACGHGGVRISGEVVADAPPARALVDRAAGTSGLIVGAHASGAPGRLRLGSVSQQVVVHARSPVVVVPPDPVGHDTDDKVVVGIDASPGAQVALERAAEEARVRGSELELVMVQPPPDPERSREAEQRWFENSQHWRNQAEQQLVEALGRLDPATRPARVRREVVATRHAARALLDVAAWARLLVVGSRGRGGFTGMLLGSVSQHCVRHATSPVMVVPAST